jgi:VWFA-related protein
MRSIAVAFAVLALAVPAFAQEQPPFQEKIDVNAVLLDVIVTDSRGNQILGLGPDDFIVEENGVVQEIDSVDYFTNRRLLDQREEQAPFKVERVREERYFVFFFDKPSDPGALFDQVALARDAVRRFVDEDMKETDRVAIAGHDMRLKLYSDFTSDKKQILRALDDAAKFGRGLTGRGNATEEPSILANLDVSDMVKGTGTVYRALDVLADSLRPIRARKNLVLFSPGIADREESVFGGQMLSSRSRDLDPMLNSLNAANVSVYGIQLQRNVNLRPLFHQRLEELADSTGGQYFRLNTTFGPAVEKIEETNAGYYLITYRTRRPAGERGFQKVGVKLKNREFRVVARSGYQLD